MLRQTAGGIFFFKLCKIYVEMVNVKWNPNLACFQPSHLSWLRIPVIQTPAVQTAILPGIWAVLVTVLVCPRWLGPHQTADRNVLSTLNVLKTKHASTENVKIPVQGSVESMPTAGSETTSLCVFVTRAMLEIPSPAVTDRQVRFTQKIQIFSLQNFRL